MPTVQAIKDLCWAAGFSRAEVVQGPPDRPAADFMSGLRHGPPSAPTTSCRAIVHAYISRVPGDPRRVLKARPGPTIGRLRGREPIEPA